MDKKKIIILIAILVVLIIVIAVFAFNSKPSTPSIPDNSNSQNNSSINNTQTPDEDNKEPEKPTTKIEGEKRLENLVFSNVRIVEEGVNQNLLIADVKNNGTENILEGQILNIELFDENGDSIGIVGAILPFVAADSTAEMKVPIAVDVMYTNNISISYAKQ